MIAAGSAVRLLVIVLVVVGGRLRVVVLLAQDTLKDLGHIFDGVIDFARDEERSLVLEREHGGVAGTGIELDDFFAQFVFHTQEDAGKKGAFLDVIDDDVIDGGAEAGQDVADEIVSERTFFFDAVQGHLDGIADGMIDVDYKRLVVVAEEHGAAIGRGHHAFDDYGDNVVFHGRQKWVGGW